MQDNSTAHTSRPPTRKAILVVENTASRQQGIPAALEAAGHEVFQSTSGIVALEILRMLVVDLVIAEVDLLQMDGIEFTRQVRAQAYLQRTPIVLLATDTRGEGETLGRQAGVTAWLKKPVSHDQLMTLIGEIFAGQAEVPTGARERTLSAAGPESRTRRTNPTNATT